MTDDKVRGLLLAVIAAIFVHIVMLAGTWILNHIFHFNSIEKASIIYTNAGYLIIPLVGAVLGSEWVFYTTAFILVQTVLMWTHCTCLISESRQKDWKKILFNPNIVAMLLGLLLFLFRVQLPGVIASCVSGFGQMISPASMLVIGMAIGNVDLKWVFTQKRPYLICFFRLIFYPILGVIGFGILGQMGIHPDAEYILMVVLLATAAPAAAMVTQLAQLYNKDVKYASVINVMSVIFCIVTMPVMVMLYEMFY